MPEQTINAVFIEEVFSKQTSARMKFNIEELRCQQSSHADSVFKETNETLQQSWRNLQKFFIKLNAKAEEQDELVWYNNKLSLIYLQYPEVITKPGTLTESWSNERKPKNMHVRNAKSTTERWRAKRTRCEIKARQLDSNMVDSVDQYMSKMTRVHNRRHYNAEVNIKKKIEEF